MTLAPYPNYWRLPDRFIVESRIADPAGSPPAITKVQRHLPRAATMPQMRSAYLGSLRDFSIVFRVLMHSWKPFRRMIVSVPSTRRLPRNYIVPAAWLCGAPEVDDYVRFVDRLGTPRRTQEFC